MLFIFTLLINRLIKSSGHLIFCSLENYFFYALTQTKGLKRKTEQQLLLNYCPAVLLP